MVAGLLSYCTRPQAEAHRKEIGPWLGCSREMFRFVSTPTRERSGGRGCSEAPSAKLHFSSLTLVTGGSKRLLYMTYIVSFPLSLYYSRNINKLPNLLVRAGRKDEPPLSAPSQHAAFTSASYRLVSAFCQTATLILWLNHPLCASPLL